ncbi:sulfatase-like hydrolase/transferase [Aeoliella mucimassa]|uniref:Arylsulfatase n=1 Tax=Aeoliella mucimassa TaxID=2527972 RepID=A0A518ALS0_9BACT|nr:sulfatase-like hydrolase/transferase [Aeoliella mucimassa]QDU55658.1 Arylsulfatase [Aeoliella mucimassa]
MIRIALHAVLLVTLITTLAVADDRPNILVLYSDDAGYGDFGFQPDCVPEMKQMTPHIDSIASDGVRFSNAYMSGCVCSPSRAGLMVGRYQQRFGHDNNLPPGSKLGLSLDETFGASRLQQLGYHTGLIGKWHLGYADAYHPNARGFDWFYGLLQGSRSYYPLQKPSPHQVIQEDGKATAERGYVTDRFGDAACEFLRREHDRPFFLFVSFTAPHGPNQPKEADLDRLSHIAPGRRRRHCGLTVALDDNVGKILECLDEQRLADNTLVIFTNDNGGQTQTGANNNPLSGHKGELLEGGIRVPMAMRWPGKIDAGTVIDDPVISLDLVPTFLSAAGTTPSDAWQLDGTNLTGRLTGELTSLPDRPLFWRKGGSQGARAIRQGNWKLLDLRTEGSTAQLFDLASDPKEQRDVSAAHPETAKSLAEKLDAWEAELIEPRWGPGA